MTAGARRRTTGLVARERELELLISTVARPPSVVIVEGEAGIGKSRLLAELGRGPRDPRRGRMTLRTGCCRPETHTSPLAPVVEALRDVGPDLDTARLGPVTGVLRPLLPELAALLPPAPGSLAGGATDAHQVFRALRELLAALGPTVLVLEDMHWADDLTVDLLHFLVTSPPSHLSLVLSYRREDLPSSSPLNSLASRLAPHLGYAHITLAPLDAAGVAALVAAVLDLGGGSEELVRYLHERTGGNPSAVEEVLRMLQEREDLVRRNGRWARREGVSTPVPTAIRDAVLARLLRLSEHGRLVAFAAAVLGQRATQARLGEVAALGHLEARNALSEVLGCGLLSEDTTGAADFRHDLARQAVYEAIPGYDRRQLHVRAAEVCERDHSCSEWRLARHFREAGLLDKWAVYAEHAADEALARFDNAGASRILHDLLACSPPGTADRIRLARKLGRAGLLCRGQREAAEALRGVLADDELPEAGRGEMRLLLGVALWHAGDARPGMEEVRRAVTELRDEPVLASQAMRALGYPVVPDGELGDHLRWLDQARETADNAGDDAGRLGVAVDRATLLMVAGDQAAWDASDQLLEGEVPRELAAYRARMWARLAEAGTAVGHYDRARQFVARGLRSCEEIDFPLPVPSLLSTEAYLDWLTGRRDGLDERAQRLVEDERDRPPILAVLVLALLKEMRRGGADAAAGLAAASDLAWRRGAFAFFSAAAGGLARSRLAAGAPEAAVKTAMTALELARAKAIWVWGSEALAPAVEAMVQLGQLGTARALVAEFARGVEGRAAPAAHASLLLSEAILEDAQGDARATGRAYAAAASAYAAFPRPYDVALAEERAGRALIDLDRTEGVERLTAALSVERLGAARDGARIRQLLRRHDVKLPYPWRGGRRSLGDVLSAREEEILALIAEGRTYRQIGELLSLSPRTVETHLHRARRKQQRARGQH